MDILIATLTYSPAIVFVAFVGFVSLMKVFGLPMDKWRLRR